MTKHNYKKIIKAKQAGFTLMEMLVAISIFSVLMVSATGIFMMASKAQRKVFDMQEMQTSARFALEAIVREIRTGHIDYNYYAEQDQGIESPERTLALIDNEESELRFFVSDESNKQYCADELSEPCLLVTLGASTPAPLTPKGIRITSAGFFITPDVDPMFYDQTIAGYQSDKQPIVTILLSMQSLGRKSGEATSLFLQTTATSRLYSR